MVFYAVFSKNILREIYKKLGLFCLQSKKCVYI